MFKFFRKKKKQMLADDNQVIDNSTVKNNDNNSTENSKQESNKQQSVKKEQGSQADMMQAVMSGALGGADINTLLDNIDTSQLSLKEKMGLKMLKKLPRHKQEEIIRQALNPQELYKHKDKVLRQIDEMVKAGQIDKSQAEAIKSQMGLR